MKRKILFTFIALCCFCQCARYKVTYNIPPEMPEQNRKILTAKLDEGKKLFRNNCAVCHGIFSKGKDSVENFTDRQFDNYTMRFLRRDPKNHAVMAKMSIEQYNDLINFLKYKKPRHTDSVGKTRLTYRKW